MSPKKSPNTSYEDDDDDDEDEHGAQHTEPLIKIEFLDRLPSQEELEAEDATASTTLEAPSSKLKSKRPNVAKAATVTTCEDRVRQYPPGTLHVDAGSGELICTRCNVVMDHTRKASIDKHLKAQMHLKNKSKKKVEVKVEEEEAERERDREFLESTPGRVALYVSCEARARQFPEGTLHVDPDSGDLMCSTCNVVMDHTRKASIDKHLQAKSHLNGTKRPGSVLRVNAFQKFKRRKTEELPEPEPEPSPRFPPRTTESNQVSKASIKVTPAERVDQYPRGMLHVEDAVLFCSVCNVSLDYTRKGSIDKHLRTQLHTEKQERQERLREERERRQSAAYVEAFPKITEARDGRNLALFRLVEAFTAAEIPLHKLDHPKLRDYLMENVSNLGALPSSARLRVGYLPKVRETLRLEKERKMAALDETIDSVRIDSLSYLIHQGEQ